MPRSRSGQISDDAAVKQKMASIEGLLQKQVTHEMMDKAFRQASTGIAEATADHMQQTGLSSGLFRKIAEYCK